MKMPGLVRRLGRLIVSPPARQNALHEWRRQRRGEPDLPPGPIRHVLICCLGNICRSPFAASLLTDLRPQLSVRSAGFETREGAPAEPAAVRAAARFGVDLAPGKAHSLATEDVDWADLILAMEGHHAARLARRWPRGRARTRLLGDFLSAPPHTIGDPWGRSDEVFEFTFERIAAALGRVAERLDARGPGCSGGS